MSARTTTPADLRTVLLVGEVHEVVRPRPQQQADDEGIEPQEKAADPQEREFVRILWVDVEFDNVTFLRLGREAFPKTIDRDEFEKEIQEGTLRRTDDHPYRRSLLPTLIGEPAKLEKNGILADVTRSPNAVLLRDAEVKRVAAKKVALAPLMEAARRGILFVTDKAYRLAIRERAAGTGVSELTVQRWLRRYFEYGMNEAALGTFRDLCGGPGQTREWKNKPGEQGEEGPKGIPLNKVVRDRLLWGANWYITNPCATLEQAYLATMAEYYAVPGETEIVGGVETPKLLPETERPTERQFRDFIRPLVPRKARIVGKFGQRHWDLNARDLVGTTAEYAFAPGSLFVIDASRTAINVVDRKTRRRNIGQLTIYLVIDDFSRAIVAFLVTTRPENSRDAALALGLAFSTPIRARRVKKGEVQPPDIPGFACKMVFSDKGSAFLADTVEEFGSRLGFALGNPPGGRADQKGQIEWIFKDLYDALNKLPGALSKKRRGRGAKKRGEDARLTIPEYERAVAEYAYKHNHLTPATHAPLEAMVDGDYPTPFELALWGFEHRGVPERKTGEEVALCLLEKVEGRVDTDGRGLKVGHLLYRVANPREEPALDLDLTRGGSGIRKPWTVLRDPTDVTHVWVPNRQGRLVKLALAGGSIRFEGCTLHEVSEFFSALNRAKRAKKPELQLQKAASDIVITGIAASARQLGIQATSKGPVKEIRAEEAAHQERAARAAIGPVAVPSQVPPEAPVPSAPTPQRTSMLDRMKASRARLRDEDRI